MNGGHSLFAADRASLLRIYLGEADRVSGRPVHQEVLERARQHGLAGATVFRGSGGFGANSLIHHASPWRLSQDLPVLIEIVDIESAIQSFLPVLQELLSGGGLVTLEPVQIVRYQAEIRAPKTDGGAS